MPASQPTDRTSGPPADDIPTGDTTAPPTDELAPMAAVAHRLAEANPFRDFHFIPLRNGAKPGDEGKIPFTPGWQTSGGVDLEDTTWAEATGYGEVLTDNQWLFCIDIDGDQHLTAEQRKAITDLPALTYRTRKGRHYLMGVPPDVLPPMNSRSVYGGPWGELYYHAERQVALCGSANKHLPDNLTIPDAPIEAVQAAIKLLCPPDKKRTQETRADNYHDRLLRAAQRLVREGQTAEQIYDTLKDSDDQAEAVKERSTADDDLKRLIRWCLDNTPAEDIDRWWPTPQPNDPIRVKEAFRHITDQGKTLNGKQVGFSDKTGARIIATALYVRTCPDHELWAYDPQQGYHRTGAHAEALINRAIRFLIETWKPPLAGKKEGVRKYTAQTAGQITHLLKLEHPSHAPGVPDNPMLLGFQNGVLDLADPSGPLLPHHPQNGITRTIPHPHPGPNPPRPGQFFGLLNQVIPDKPEQRLFQQAAAVALSELPPPQEMVTLVGEGGSGKSQLLECVRLAIGPEYCRSISPKELGENLFVKQQLGGNIAVNLPTELENMGTADTGPFKELTGGDYITGQVKNSNEPNLFICRATWIGATNSLPNPKIDATWAFARRWLPITCGDAVPEDKVVVNFAQKIMAAEAPGVINWILEGLTSYIANQQKYDVPQSVIDHRNTWQSGGGVCAEFVSANITQPPIRDGIIPMLYRPALRKAFTRYCDDEDIDKDTRPDWADLYYAIRQRYPKSAVAEVTTGRAANRGFPFLALISDRLPTDDDGGF